MAVWLEVPLQSLKMLQSANKYFKGGKGERRYQCVFRDVICDRTKNRCTPEALISTCVTPHMSLELRGWIFKGLICISLDLMQLSL